MILVALSAVASVSSCLIYYLYVKLSFNYKDSWARIQISNTKLLISLKAIYPHVPWQTQLQYVPIIAGLEKALTWPAPTTYNEYRNNMLRLLPMLEALNDL
jgi:hypothetical protein